MLYMKEGNLLQKQNKNIVRTHVLHTVPKLGTVTVPKLGTVIRMQNRQYAAYELCRMCVMQRMKYAE
jgi:hypothetical protein